jgi:enoyl-CoA hydratase
VDIGRSRPEAEKLAEEIATFPQTCLRQDRLSAYEQNGMNMKQALENELEHGLKTLASGEIFEGAKRFTKGNGKHGQF